MIPYPSSFTQKFLLLVEPKSNRILGICQFATATAIDETAPISYAGLSIVPKRRKSPLSQDGKKVDMEYLCLEISETMARDRSFRHDPKYLSLVDVPNATTHSSGSHQPNVLRVLDGPLLEFLKTSVSTSPIEMGPP